MGAGNTSLQTSIPQQLQLGGSIDSPGRYSLVWSAQVQQCYHETSSDPSKNNRILAIPGGAYMISPLAIVSVWAALKLKLIAWHHLRVWIALWEVRTWRDTMEAAQRNLFRFTPKRIAHVLGKGRASPQLKQALADLEQLGLTQLTPTEISFTTFLDDLQPDLRAETKHMLESLGNENVTHAIRMPRRLMRLIMNSRARPLRAAVLFGMLLRMTQVKRYRWYKGCLTTKLLTDVSGFNESRIKHERAALIREGCFERLETAARVRQQYGDWYALGHDLPAVSDHKTGTKRQPPKASTEANRQPPIKKPAPSFGIETNQFLPARPGASHSTPIPQKAGVPNWHHIVPEDLREPRRRIALYKHASQKGVIGNIHAEKLLFYSAMARARRLASLNQCGMLRRIVETTAYRRYIADCDEDQARAWLREMEPQSALDLLTLVTPQDTVDFGPADVEVYRILAHGLMGEGYDPTAPEAYDVVKRKDKNKVLRGWTRERWVVAKAEALGQRLSPEIRRQDRGGPGNL